MQTVQAKAKVLCRVLLLLSLNGTGCGPEASELQQSPALPQVIGGTQGARPEATSQKSFVVLQDALCGQPDVQNVSGFPQTLLKAGHRSAASLLGQEGETLFAADSVNGTSAWFLWNMKTRRQIASDGHYLFDHPWFRMGASVGPSRNIILVPSARALELRSTADGRMLTRIEINDAKLLGAGLARDASYVWATTATMLTVWTQDGRKLIEEPGRYDLDAPAVLATPGALYLPRNSAHTIDIIEVASGSTLPGPRYVGAFARWLSDGGFITTTSNDVRVYDRAGAQRHLQPVAVAEELGADGAWLWIAAETATHWIVNVYAIGDTKPVATYDLPLTEPAWSNRGPIIAAPGSIGFLNTKRGTLWRLDLTGSAPTMQAYVYPVDRLDGYTAARPGDWTVSGAGVLFPGADYGAPDGPLYASCGPVLGLSGARSSIAVATADRRIRVLDLSPANRGKPLLTLSYPTTHVELSRDGTILLATGRDSSALPMGPLRAFAVPSGRVLRTWDDLDEPDKALFGYTISDDGTRVAREICDTLVGDRQACDLYVSELQEDRLLFHAGPIVRPRARREVQSLRLSPDGSRLAYSPEDVPLTRTTLVYERAGDASTEARLVVTIPGHLGGWESDDRLLVNQYDWRATAVAPTFREVTYVGTAAVDLQGTTLWMHRGASIDPGSLRVDGDSSLFFGSASNGVYDLSSGKPRYRWPSSDSRGDLVGDEMVWHSSGSIYALKWREAAISGGFF